jgi:hypothetical protein
VCGTWDGGRRTGEGGGGTGWQEPPRCRTKGKRKVAMGGIGIWRKRSFEGHYQEGGEASNHVRSPPLRHADPLVAGDPPK